MDLLALFENYLKQDSNHNLPNPFTFFDPKTALIDYD
jgi:hypothetical protein